MKRTFPLTIIFLLALNAYSQDGYFPLVEGNKTWNIQHYAYPNFYSTQTLRTFSDTLINDTLRYGLYNSMEEFPENWILQGFLREDDDKRVYYSYVISSNPLTLSEEHLIYDFTAETGDTLEVHNFSFAQIPLMITIEEEDSIVVNGEMRRRIRYEHLESPAQGETYWIEGLGSNEGLLSTGNYYVVIDIGTWLNCVLKDEVLVYMSPEVNECYISSVGIAERDSDRLFKVYPNPTSGRVSVRACKPDTDSFIFSLFDTKGKEVMVIVSDQGTSLFFDLRNYGQKSGLYFYHITTPERSFSGKILLAD